MPAYEYKALDSRGKQKHGVVEADAPRAVRQQLRERGLTPLAVEPAAEKQARSNPLSSRGSLAAADLALVTRQLATLIQSGIPIEQALSAAAQQSPKPRIRSMLIAIRAKVMEGYTLADSLVSFQERFRDCTGLPLLPGNMLAIWIWYSTGWRITPKAVRRRARRFNWRRSTPSF